ncbi:histidine kinase [Ponticoccus sp. SC2-23]|nr:DUF6446 family protein [Alexandriicola marinus]MBM1221045.1 histidine kinase [Ponticoccus sp. SC6-9]MBM1225615.1 histidine kinase [Ponticoccus sp. SC6-15]MBM1227767.1 histidine kinase [Ponticoccus sp. SC6-38]MBM1234595.1 histidine kinase [Ponticoccus sp. SC6-45]MBM1238269.1 histidine kinase [Ponticoccus sp. SC6-49]MBM1243538.1 histidine kinase [Ponticoccus sp. SC2-64]MBM1248119.1 histidine kinase [Ponticoccus sp. SC6-42]MBM1252669.1 histidine kinase [Ponticoccus sp. SC6-33]MBM1256278.1 
MGRIAILAIVGVALIAGVLMYYLQLYAYYEEVSAEEVGEVQLVTRETGEPVAIAFENFKAIDSTSAPIRFRACFDIADDPATLAETYVTYDGAEPLVAPGWFDCFDAEAIGTALESGEAIAFLSAENITYGIDRIVAVMPGGRAVAWHQINACGEVVFDGDPAPEGCPPVPERLQ